MMDKLFDLQLFADEGTEGGEGGLLSGDNGAEDKGSEGGLLSGEGDKGADNGADEGEQDKGTDDKGEGDKGADGDSDKDKEEKPEGAPEKYDAFKVPEGVTIDETAATEFGALAKELNLTQENAQKLVDYQVKFQQAQNARLDAVVKKQSDDWAAETLKSYKKEDLADARRGFKSAPKDVQTMLAACGFDNHKSFVEFFMKVGKSLKEDKFETGKGKGGSGKSTANVIYPELN
jgi:uncharacterized sporulation protein YeaH/YhbH (DUF444 family)